MWGKFLWTSRIDSTYNNFHFNMIKNHLLKLKKYVKICFASKTCNRCSTRSRRGKSGLRRAGCWITSSQGDLKDSATEIYRLIYQVRVERRGKSSPA